MKQRIFLVIFIILSTSIFGDEFFRSKIEIAYEEGGRTIRQVTYTYTILTDGGEFIEMAFDSNYIYQWISVCKYTISANKIIVHQTLGGEEYPFELQRTGQNLILEKTGKIYNKVTDVKMQ